MRLEPRYYGDLIGKSYAKHGRGPDAYDCVGLVLEVCRRMGRMLPDFVSDQNELHRQLAADRTTLADLVRVPTPGAGDIALFVTGVNEHHIGVMIDRFAFVHAIEGANVSVQRLLDPLWQRRAQGFYAFGAVQR